MILGVPGASWGDPGEVLGRPGGLLGPFGGILGPLGPVLGSLGASWWRRGASWRPLGPSWAELERALGPSKVDPGGSRGRPERLPPPKGGEGSVNPGPTALPAPRREADFHPK